MQCENIKKNKFLSYHHNSLRQVEVHKLSAIQELFPPFFRSGHPSELMRNSHDEKQVFQWANTCPKSSTKTPAYFHGGYSGVFIVYFEHSLICLNTREIISLVHFFI